MKDCRSIAPARFAALFAVPLLTLFLLGACESPHPPTPCNPLAGHTLTVGQTATVTACFEDLNLDDTLTYAVSTSDPSVATASITGTIVTVTAAVPGFATITITATDPEGLQGHARFTVTVPNRAPVTEGAIESVTIPVGTTINVDVAEYFSEPDGQTLTYSVASSAPDVAAASNSQQIVIVSSLAHGTATITVTATDPGDLSATQSFMVTVPNRGPEARGEIPPATIEAGNTVTLEVAQYFTDPDDDLLTYEATSSHPELVEVAAAHEAVIISSLARGTATITVKVTDPGGLSAKQAFTVTVPNRAPEARGSVAGVLLYVGDTRSVDLSASFADPDGDSLTYAASTADATITASVDAGGTVTVNAVATGSGTVTVTATDPGGLSATQTLPVTIPNRPPRAGLPLPAFEVRLDYPAQLNVTPHFADPDGHDLTYTSSTSSGSVATVSVSGATLTVTPVAPGTATLTVTATDPGGLEVSQGTTVTVREPDPGYFADGFDTNASIGEWTISQARARVRDGVLNLTNSRGDRRGMAYRDHPVTEWSVSAILGRADATASVALVMSMDHDRYTHYILQIGSGSGVQVNGVDTNYRFLLYDAEEDEYSYPPGLQGHSDVIDDGPGEFTEITFSLIYRQLRLHVGETELFRSFPLGDDLAVAITGLALVSWPHEARAGRTVLFDFLEVNGELVGGDLQARRSGAAERIDRLPAPGGPDGIRIREVPGLRVAPPGR